MAAETTPRKMLRILDLIEESADPVTAETMLAALGFTRSTLYRHLKILTETGLITSLPDAGFTLGPRIVELDYKMRQRDPLLAAAQPLMIELAQSERGVALLCRRYKDKVLCIHQERGDVAFRSNYTRGLGRPLFRGAASRVILAHLSGPTVSRLYADAPEAFAAGGLGETQAEARSALRRIRAAGFDVTHGQVTAGVTGVAAPLLDRGGDVLGSLSLTLPARERDATELQRLGERVRFCAGVVRTTLGQEYSA
jgi:DNA-binding IclR family transcriptional regulator